MYKIPYTGTRVVMKFDRDATINAAKTNWGKRRAEKFFARFLDERIPVWVCHALHPVAATRASDFMLQNTGIEAISTSWDRADDNVICSSGTLRDFEFDYLLARRNFDKILDREYGYSGIRFQEARIYKVWEAELELDRARDEIFIQVRDKTADPTRVLH